MPELIFPKPIWSALFIVLISQTLFTQELKKLDHDAYDIWHQIHEKEISPNGEWIGFVHGPENEDGFLVIQNRFLEQRYQMGPAEDFYFTFNSEHVVYRRLPSKTLVRSQKRAKVKKDDLPGDSLGILHLKSGEEELDSRNHYF